MKTIRFLSFFAFLLPLITSADVLELKDGRILNGTYQGGTAGTLRFAVDGQMQVIPVTDVIALTIVRDGSTAPAPTAAAAAPAAAAQTTPAPAPAPAAQTVVVPAGESLIVRLRSTISTRNARAGQKFDAILESDLRAGEVILAPRGSVVTGTVVSAKAPRRLNKSASLAITLDGIKTDHGSLTIHTQPHEAHTNERGAIVRGAAKGAAVGLITSEDVDNAAGAGAAIAAVQKGDQIVFEADSLLTFVLDKAVSAAN